jgi:HEPN domain-containing protein
MEFDFSDSNFEKGKVHFKEGTKKLSRSRLLALNKDWAGSVEASQHAIEFFIKTLYLISGNSIPKTHDAAKKIDPIFEELQKINPELFQNALENPYKWIKEISKKMQKIHSRAMYGDTNIPASYLFDQNDAVKYYEMAQYMMILILIIAFQFGYHYENLPREGRDFLDKTSPGFYRKKEDLDNG